MSHLTPIQIAWILTWAAVLAGCGFAMVRGGLPERQAATVILVSALISQSVVYVPGEWRSSLAMMIDGASALALLFLTVRYASLWLGALMLLQAALFSLYSIYVLSSRPLDSLYSVINNGLVLFQVTALTIGVLGSIRRRRRAKANILTAPIGSPPTP